MIIIVSSIKKEEENQKKKENVFQLAQETKTILTKWRTVRKLLLLRQSSRHASLYSSFLSNEEIK